ncbi:MAG: hypothetical protein J2P13_03200 [Acidobacteria bacterium]|nr:hypothetical protein [Acidobacteriota bacterium]
MSGAEFRSIEAVSNQAGLSTGEVLTGALELYSRRFERFPRNTLPVLLLLATLLGTLGPVACARPYTSRTDSDYVPAPVIPAFSYNVPVEDADFHNPIVRVTPEDGRNYIAGLGGSGDAPQTWNSNDTMLLVGDAGGGYAPIGFDPVNFKTTGPVGIKTGPGVFSHSQPNIFYAFAGSQVNVLDLARKTSKLLYDFHACGVGAVEWRSIGGSDTTDRVFAAAFSAGVQGTGYQVAVYNSVSGVCFLLDTRAGTVTQYPGATRIGTVSIPDRFLVHNVKIKGPSEMVVVEQACVSNCTSKQPFSWVIGTTRMFALGQPQGSGHWAEGCTHFINAPGNPTHYAVKRPLTDPTAWVDVWAMPKDQCGAAPLPACALPVDAHPAWVGGCDDKGMVFMATTKHNDIIDRPYEDEIIGFSTDGSNRVYRFAHTYSSFLAGGFYAQNSIGAPSPDGRFYAWTTKAGGQFAGTSAVLVVKMR